MSPFTFLSNILAGLLVSRIEPGLTNSCPGLVTKPEPRHEVWNIKWAEELAREVREADSGEVTHYHARSQFWHCNCPTTSQLLQ